jgi:hypothetical protein
MEARPEMATLTERRRLHADRIAVSRKRRKIAAELVALSNDELATRLRDAAYDVAEKAQSTGRGAPAIRAHARPVAVRAILDMEAPTLAIHE